jgi:hypothetical protein
MPQTPDKNSEKIFCDFCGSDITTEDGYMKYDAIIHKIYGFLCHYCAVGVGAK